MLVDWGVFPELSSSVTRTSLVRRFVPFRQKSRILDIGGSNMVEEDETEVSDFVWSMVRYDRGDKWTKNDTDDDTR